MNTKTLNPQGTNCFLSWFYCEYDMRLMQGGNNVFLFSRSFAELKSLRVFKNKPSKQIFLS